MMFTAFSAIAINSASPIPADAGFVQMTLRGGASVISLCIAERYHERPLVAFVYHKIDATYVRFKIIRTRTSAGSSACPQASADIALSDLPAGGDYVVGVFALPMPAQLPSADSSSIVTFGAPGTLEPVLYFGLHIEA